MKMSAHYIFSLSQYFSLLLTEVPAAAALSAVQVLRPLSILAAWYSRAWVRVVLDNPLHPLTTAHNQPNWGMGLRPIAVQWSKQSWFGLGGGIFMGTDWGIPVWKAELILNLPEGISAGWGLSLKEILEDCNFVLYKAWLRRDEDG